jgi:hypothetical protein
VKSSFPDFFENFHYKLTQEMPQNRWRPGLCPGPHWGSLRRSPRPPSRMGRGPAPPQTPPPSTPSASRCSAPSAPHLSPPELKSCLRPWGIIFFPSPPFPSLAAKRPSLKTQLGSLGERCKFLQRIRAKPGNSTDSVHSWSIKRVFLTLQKSFYKNILSTKCVS